MAETSNIITLEKSIPEIAEAFAGCKVGDQYEVTGDDEDTLTLTAIGAEPVEEPEEEAEEEVTEEPAYGSKNPAVAKLMKRKSK